MKRVVYLLMVILLSMTSSYSVNASHEFSCTPVTEIPQPECEALAALYNSTNGPRLDNQHQLVADQYPQ